MSPGRIFVGKYNPMPATHSAKQKRPFAGRNEAGPAGRLPLGVARSHQKLRSDDNRSISSIRANLVFVERLGYFGMTPGKPSRIRPIRVLWRGRVVSAERKEVCLAVFQIPNSGCSEVMPAPVFGAAAGDSGVFDGFRPRTPDQPVSGWAEKVAAGCTHQRANPDGRRPG